MLRLSKEVGGQRGGGGGGGKEVGGGGAKRWCTWSMKMKSKVKWLYGLIYNFNIYCNF